MASDDRIRPRPAGRARDCFGDQALVSDHAEVDECLSRKAQARRTRRIGATAFASGSVERGRWSSEMPTVTVRDESGRIVGQRSELVRRRPPLGHEMRVPRRRNECTAIAFPRSRRAA